MKELILKLTIDAPYGFPWGRSLKYQNLEVSKEEVIGHLRDLNLNLFDLRKEFSWSVELAVYESAATYNTLEDVKKNIRAKLENFKKVAPYLNDELLSYILSKKTLNQEKKLDLFKRVLKNQLTDKEKENNKELITSWLVEIVSFSVMSSGFEKVEDIKEEVFEYLNSNCKYLNVEKDKLESSLTKMGIGLGKNIELFKSIMVKDKARFEALLIKEEKEAKKVEKIETSPINEDDLTESILGLFDSMEEVEETETKQKIVKEKSVHKCESKLKKEAVSNLKNIAEKNTKKVVNDKKGESKKEENKCCKTISNNEEVYKNMAALAKSLGYELLDSNKVQVSKDYYEKLNSSKSEDEKVIKQLVSLENGAVLSQLYNTYKSLNKISLDNIEAVMSNFFSTLFAMGFEVNEDEAEIGENITVNTKDLFKEFLFSKPVSKDGEINGQVEHLSWNYKGKTIMPKIVKPIE